MKTTAEIIEILRDYKARSVLRLFGAFRTVPVSCSVPTVYDREIPGFVRYKHIRRWIMAVVIRSVG